MPNLSVKVAVAALVACAGPVEAQWAKVAIDIAAGGGFVGLRSAEVQSTPRTLCEPGTPPMCQVDPERKVLSKAFRYAWQPAVATGLVFRFVPSPKVISRAATGSDTQSDGIGFGLGTHFVFLPQSDATRAAPAVTINVGRASQQAFFGLVFSPVDEIDMPGGGASAVVPAAFDGTALVRRGAGRGAQFFAGVVIGGVAVTRPTSR